MSNLHVSFGDPNYGWLPVNIQSDDQIIDINVSYIYETFFPLIGAMRLLKSSTDERVVTLLCEPTELDLRFCRAGEIFTLDVFEYPDSSRNLFQQEATLSISGNYDEVCLPFWRALRHLQARFTADELEARWQRKFPYQEFDNLTELLGKNTRR